MEAKEKARILLVDDEPAVNRLMQTYLSRMGYSVDTAMNGADAFTLMNKSTEPYHLLVADVSLPDTQGDDLAVQLAEADPKLRVLLCSGYPVAVDALPDALQQRFATLQKPFLPTMLAEQVEELLQRNLK